MVTMYDYVSNVYLSHIFFQRYKVPSIAFHSNPLNIFVENFNHGGSQRACISLKQIIEEDLKEWF